MSEAPKCPRCDTVMVLRTARKGKHRGNQFYGCSNYPRCTAIIDLSEVNSKFGNGEKISCELKSYTSPFDYNQEESNRRLDFFEKFEEKYMDGPIGWLMAITWLPCILFYILKKIFTGKDPPRFRGW